MVVLEGHPNCAKMENVDIPVDMAIIDRRVIYQLMTT